MARHLWDVVPEGACMVRRSVITTLFIVPVTIASTGCASHRGATVATPDSPTILPALVSSADMSDFAPQHYGPDAGELRWLASRNDSQRAGLAGTPEVADPGAYSIVTRDYQRTINGRPWNYWTTETRVFQRGSNR